MGNRSQGDAAEKNAKDNKRLTTERGYTAPLFICSILSNMEYNEAIEILKGILKNHPLNEKEKEAVMTALGVLSWGGLYESKLKDRKSKRDKSAQW